MSGLSLSLRFDCSVAAVGLDHLESSSILSPRTMYGVASELCQFSGWIRSKPDVSLAIQFMHPGGEIKHDGELTAEEKRGVERGSEFRAKGSGASYEFFRVHFSYCLAYANMQGTTPYTLGTALAMHPVSLLAYIVCDSLQAGPSNVCTGRKDVSLVCSRVTAES